MMLEPESEIVPNITKVGKIRGEQKEHTYIEKMNSRSEQGLA